MKWLKNTRQAISGLLILGVIFFLVFFAGTRYAKPENEPVITSSSLKQQLMEVSELSTMEYRYTKVGKFENSLTLNGWEIPLTKKSFLLTYSGVLKSGIDLKQACVEVKDHTILVSLPDVEIVSHTIDESSIEVFDEEKNIFNPISINDYKTFAIQQKAKVEEEAIEEGLFSEAATKTKQVIEKYLKMIPMIQENYSIEIQFKKA